MNLKDLVVVTGMPGIQRIAANRANGMMVEDLDTGVVRFAPIRKHQFSPLESISVYVEGDDDSVELKQVLQSMLDKLNETPPPSPDAKADAFRAYFKAVLPNHDEDRVHISDIKKITRWFFFLNGRGFLTMPEPADEEEE